MSAVIRCLAQVNPDDGSVWHFFPEHGATVRCQNCRESRLLWDAVPIRGFQVLGCRANAGLISELMDTVCRVPTSEFGTLPLVLGQPLRSLWPIDFSRFIAWASALAQSWRPWESRQAVRFGQRDVPVFRGDWHVATLADRAIYRLILEIQQSQPCQSTLRACLDQHPAALLLRWLGRFPLQATARLLSDLVDVKWFRDPRYPQRISRLAMFCGVQSSRGDRYWSKVLGSSRDCLSQRAKRAQDLVALWSTGKLCAQSGEETVDWHGTDDPCLFFMDLFESGRKLGSTMRMVCRKFLNLLALSWVDGLYLANGRKPPPLVDATAFFGPRSELQQRWEKMYEAV